MTRQRIRYVVAMLLTGVAVTSATSTGTRIKAEDSQQDGAASAATKVNAIGLRLFGELGRKSQGNVLLSPLSIETLLAILSSGASGQTAAQLRQVTGLNHGAGEADPQLARLINGMHERTVNSDVSLYVSSALWVQEGDAIRKTFRETVHSAYRGNVDELNFSQDPAACRRHVNAWVAQQTGNKIRELLQPADVSVRTRLILANAISFEATWETPFLVDETKDATFHAAAGKMTTVPMMHRSGEMRYNVWENARVIELPYKGEAFAFLVLLPLAADGLQALERSLEKNGLGPVVDSFPPVKLDIDLYLPRFSADLPLYLDEPLKAMGLMDLFSPKADLTGISESNWPVSQILTRSRIQVDEHGTAAAAASAVLEGRSRATVVRVDRPFVFLVRDTRTGLILFVGRFADPNITK